MSLKLPKRNLFTFCDSPDQYKLYHYTSIEKMWKIFDSEKLRATQACFSNDKEEIINGISVINDICKNESELKCFQDGIAEEYIDSYIICFCKENDRLSQWRGYCKDDGVSLEFDFSKPFNKYYFADSDEQVRKEIELYPVYYYIESESIYPDDTKIEFKNKQSLKDMIVKKKSENHDSRTIKNALISLVPFIKNSGFYEEAEYRWLINNIKEDADYNLEFKYDDLIKYSDNDNDKKPYINISFKKKKYETNEKSIIYISGNGKFNDDTNKKLKKVLNEAGDIDTRIIDKIVIHRIISENNEIIIGEMEEKLQKTVFRVVDRINSPSYNKVQDINPIKIWCCGHLPIRSITISPSIKQDELYNMIKHYCIHKSYWMKYIDIRKSKIPFRSY